jgi:putative restriction endonuclease
MTIATKFGTPWSREELVLALYLYCQIPFAKTKSNNPEVIRLARLLGRTPTSIARKLGNFGAFDPLLAERGIVGLTHASRADRQIWKEFYGRWDDLVVESQSLLSAVTNADILEVGSDSVVISRPEAETERQATVLVRLCQSFFRRSVLATALCQN